MAIVRTLSVAAIFVFGLAVVATDATAAKKLVPYSTVNEADPNGHIDTGVTNGVGLCGWSNPSGGTPGTGAGGNPPSGCYTRTGGLCSASPNVTCILAGVPAGRCTKGTGSCIWPQGAGTCVDDAAIACLSDTPGDHGSTGTFKSAQCADANTGNSDDLYDQSTNLPACTCQGTVPSLSTWEWRPRRSG